MAGRPEGCLSRRSYCKQNPAALPSQQRAHTTVGCLSSLPTFLTADCCG